MACDAVRLVGRPVNIIVSVGGSSLAAKAATATTPIVVTEGNDPVTSGLVQSLNRPGGNLTGVMLYGPLPSAKRLELLRETVPGAKLIAILGNPSTPGTVSKSDAQSVAHLAEALGQRILILNVSSAQELEPAFATMLREGADALQRVPVIVAHSLNA